MDRGGTIAVIGGTGSEGRGLALRCAHAGRNVVIGSRDVGKAETAAADINQKIGAGRASGASNVDAAAKAELVVMTVPYAGQIETAKTLAPHLQGKIFVDATVPLIPPKVSRVQLPEGGSAVAQVQALLGPEVRVVAAFQNVSAHHLLDLSHDVDCDVLVCGDDAAACDAVIALAGEIGLRGVYGGAICNAAAVEALTSVLIAINRRYKAAGSGIRITGLP